MRPPSAQIAQTFLEKKAVHWLGRFFDGLDADDGKHFPGFLNIVKLAVDAIPAHLSVAGWCLSEIDRNRERAGVRSATLDEKAEGFEPGVLRVVQGFFHELGGRLDRDAFHHLHELAVAGGVENLRNVEEKVSGVTLWNHLLQIFEREGGPTDRNSLFQGLLIGASVLLGLRGCRDFRRLTDRNSLFQGLLIGASVLLGLRGCRLMKWQAVSFIVVTMIGASLYDPEIVGKILGWIGIEREVTQFHTLKIPILLTLGMSFAAFVTALRMKEPPHPDIPTKKPLGQSIRDSFSRTFRAGSWVLHTPAALMLLLIGLSFDSIIRLYYTVGSLWLEVIGFDPFQMGIISVVGSFAGILAAVVGGKLILGRSPDFNFRFLTVLVFIGIFSLAFPIRFWSVLFLPALWFAMRLLHFFLSNYLNRVTNAENRATVLSFRGMSMNLTYGILTWAYGMQTLFLREKLSSGDGAQASEEAEEALAHLIFTEATKWWWVYLTGVLILLWLFRKVKIRKTWNEMLQVETR